MCGVRCAVCGVRCAVCGVRTYAKFITNFNNRVHVENKIIYIPAIGSAQKTLVSVKSLDYDREILDSELIVLTVP